MEEGYWKEILDGNYAISKRGEIRRLKGGSGAAVGKLLRLHDKEGYKSVSLSVGGKPHRYYVHRLVAAAFIGPCPPGCIVNHKNGDRADCDVFNLEYITSKENSEYAARNGQVRHGSNHSFAKLEDWQIKQIREDVATGKYKQIEIAKLYSISRSTVSYIVRGKSWKLTTLEYAALNANYKPRAKLNKEQVKEIRKLFAEGTSQAELCNRFGLKPPAMHHLVHGMTWKGV